ncbi:DUF3592 domain-containing protein [Sphingomonas sp. ASY06-1R]|uniref:DUF3592 domain-containing protein n=1 Tax=Sphingomonas sp. ASY06-1R TaxID=3445771 RepID=UPI003FA33B2F
MALIGLIFVGRGAYGIVSSWKLVQTGVIAEGWIPAADRPDQSGDGLGQPIVYFTARNGQKISFIQRGYGAQPNKSHVKVFYYPSNPANTATVDDFNALWWWNIVFLFIGSCGLAIVLVVQLNTENNRS